MNAPGIPQPKAPPPLVVLLGGAVLFVVTSLAAHAYKVERQNLSRAHFDRGQKLAREGNYRSAVDEYRVALFFSHGDTNDQVALARALMELGSLDEAAAYLTELNQKDSTSGIVNLLLARIAAREHRLNDAVAYYYRAIYGFWPEASAKNRIAARFELIELLAKTGDKNRVLAELLQLVGEGPDNPDVERRVAKSLLAFGSPNRAAEVFRQVLRQEPDDGEANIGLGEAEFVMGNVAAAQSAFERALRHAPQDAQARKRLEESRQILELDPTLPTLSAGQRQQRARDLLDRTLTLLETCTSGSGRPSSGEAEELSNAAKKLLASKRGGIIEGFTPQAQALAQQLWKTRSALCGRIPDTQEPLAIVLAKLSK